jgi:hypothetical protein
MLDGLWSLRIGFKETRMEGRGVITFEKQRVLGGDSDYYYVGSYEIKNGAVQGEIEVTFYGRNVSPIFESLPSSARRKFHIRFSAKEPRGNYLTLQNYMVEDPKLEILINLTRMANLPGA